MFLWRNILFKQRLETGFKGMAKGWREEGWGRGIERKEMEMEREILIHKIVNSTFGSETFHYLF